MPARRQERFRVKLRASLPWRKALGRRAVRREVQGVPLWMPWSHLLPDYVRARPTYGQNLVEVAAGLAARRGPGDGPLQLLDIGANIGDSALQVLHRVDGRAVCVEGDPYWLDYLHRNVDADARVAVEEALLTPTEDGWGDVQAVRHDGTTKFVHSGTGDGAMARLSTRALRDKHPGLEDLRLVKSDTDGFDPGLVVAVAQTWSDRGPVLFFEFDPVLAREVGNDDPHAMWAQLADLGYRRVAVWDNTGDPLGQLDLADAGRYSARLEPAPVELGWHFWDVAVCRADDTAALAVFDQLVPLPYEAQRVPR
jgi:FkbM family methyltransferase